MLSAKKARTPESCVLCYGLSSQKLRPKTVFSPLSILFIEDKVVWGFGNIAYMLSNLSP
jgi:hypothetical protein